MDVPSHRSQNDPCALVIHSGDLHRGVELDSALRQRATRALINPRTQQTTETKEFQVGNEVLVAREASLDKAMKWPPIMSSFYGP